jgi:ketosteroid isomerase-like protein
MPNEHDVLSPLYRAFNARDIDGALRGMRPDVIWANGMEGGNVHGHDAVRAYWTRQWQMIDPHVEPARFEVQGERVMVDVHQLVRDMRGAVLLDEMVKHVFTLDGGMVSKFEIA